jgi:signal transduction histidine kinase
LVKDLSWRAVELPAASELSRRVGNLQMVVSELQGLRASTFPGSPGGEIPLRVRIARGQFASDLDSIDKALDEYRGYLERKLNAGSPMADDQHESETVGRIEPALERLRRKTCDSDWVLNDLELDQLREELENLQTLTAALPSHLYEKMSGFAAEVRSQYRTLIVGMWTASVSAGLVFTLWIKLFYQWIFRPLQTLIGGSRQVADGQFRHRIRLDTQDEMAELAEAMNDMTARFEAIRDDLDRQVQERTKQVVRSEQLASVGFLAAGVAHEINNPLASIAMCAESLESRFHGLFDETSADHCVAQNYLRMIQSEAFRCKEITEKLLDFSRIGQSRRQSADLVELVHDVTEMLRHLGKYQHKEICLKSHGPVIAPVNPQQFKQVMLNLLTNALDSIDADGTVRVKIGRRAGFAELAVVDNGSGMPPEVLEHVFEPFFTRRREGQGTGLGLSISYRIIADHGGEITAESPGPGQGATFHVRLPLLQEKENCHQQRAA